ncbi:TAXI family TRAP transporter solute-binding subunit [Nocardia sp. CDC160]|uniref:TAXI family TRAP transporter solute-binding subunit n=1 Tax=Nocardia sp. CDC160 TaxID=3112166 RepID=UPI002DB69C3F|nr:TAXI family TRAP transporter solute-binding subunit [Nocardia sp. CDC160]MEC3917361.1 TAXI family TRAP transporter solute-binding subunit [Nocardia sp. CDC160]
MISRRAVLRGAAGLAVGAALPTGLVGCSRGGGERVVRLAAGEAGGFYHAFALLLARAAAGSGLRIEVTATAGSLDNLTLLARGDADCALVLADSLVEDPDRPPAVGRVYENYLQLAVAVDSPYRGVADLRGARVNLGAAGSGATHIGEKLLTAAGVDLTEVTVTHLPLRDAAAEVSGGRLDALLWAGGLPTAALNPLRLLDLDPLTAVMRERFGYLYDPVLIPAGTYPNTAAVHTIGVANLLVATPTLPDATVGALTEVLLTHADSLVPSEAAGTQFLDARSLIGTGSVPLHPGAAAVYRRHHG